MGTHKIIYNIKIENSRKLCLDIENILFVSRLIIVVQNVSTTWRNDGIAKEKYYTNLELLKEVLKRVWQRGGGGCRIFHMIASSTLCPLS
jgi:hypothetical protein